MAHPPGPNHGTRQARHSPPPPVPPCGSTSGGSSPDAVWLTVCAWCKHAKVNGVWISCEPRDARTSAQLTHGICPNCLAAVMESSNTTRRQPRVAD